MVWAKLQFWNIMKKLGIFCITLIAFLLASCSSTRLTSTILQTDHPLNRPYNRVVVIAITGNDSLRTVIERRFAEQLKDLGYPSESSMEFFGKGGLNNLGEEGTYLKFCDEGVDAILTIVPIKWQDQLRSNTADQLSINSFYYNRIWQYARLRTDPSSGRFNWETVLFDLVTLSPHFSCQTHGKIKIDELAHSVVYAMRKSGVLKNWKEEGYQPRAF